MFDYRKYKKYKKKRYCLKCQKEFTAKAKDNRVCPRCNKENESLGFFKGEVNMGRLE